MRVIKTAVIPPKKKRVVRSVYRDKILGFKSSGFERAEVLLDEGESPENVYLNLNRYAKGLGVSVVKRGDRIFLARGDVQ
ncbi:MAG: hypothetical protein II128_01525 [Atopobiaceae bacterium]|nr:hypothetical protein [Atopobiaceae bacterium]